MTEKRYSGWTDDKYYNVVKDLKEEKIYDDADEIADLLNKFVEETEALKSDLDYFYRTYEIEERGLDIVAPMCTIGSPTPSRLALFKENERLKQQLAHHTRMHEWFRNEAYLLQNKLDNREDEIRRLKGDVE